MCMCNQHVIDLTGIKCLLIKLVLVAAIYLHVYKGNFIWDNLWKVFLLASASWQMTKKILHLDWRMLAGS